MTSIDEIGQVIKYASELEKLLDNKFSSELESKRAAGASLKGLGEKVKALELYLPDLVRKDLWVIVKIRNNVAHEGSLGNDSLSNYVSRYEKVVAALQSIEQSSNNSAWASTSHQHDGAVVSFIKNNLKLAGIVAFVIVAFLVLLVETYKESSSFGRDQLVAVLMELTAIVGGAVAAWYFLRMIFRVIHNLIANHAIWFAIGSLLFALALYGTVSDTTSHNEKMVIWSWFAGSVVVFVYSIRLFFSNSRLFNSRHARSGTTTSNNGNLDLAAYAPRNPEFTFNDVCGMTSLKSQLLAAYQDNQKSGKNGILLSGDPGNGKTFIAEAFAGELKWGFMPITIADIESRWTGQSTEQLKAVFDAATKCNKLVLFFDECDSMLRSRDTMMGGTNDESLKKANAFLTGIVDLRRNKNIIVIAATNFRDVLDGAATRDGRFDFKIEVNNPDSEARRGLLLQFSKGVTFDDGVLDRLVKRWEGFSVARIRSIAEKIIKDATAQSRRTVSTRDAMAALRAIQGSMGAILPEGTPALKDLRFDPEQLKKLMSLAKRMEDIEEVERLGGQIPKGVIFWGPPGTGKTAVAKALAMTSGWAFLPTSGNDLLQDNGQAIDKLIAKASDLRPCIVFIDEAENALGDRSTNRYGSAVTNKILAVTDGVGALNDVMFVAATNHPDLLDAAIVRGGRFSEHFEFTKPKEDTVLLMVKEWIENKASTTPFHPEFKPEVVAKHLEGMAPSDIKDKLQQAVNTGVGRMLSGEGDKFITVDDLRAVTQ